MEKLKKVVVIFTIVLIVCTILPANFNIVNADTQVSGVVKRANATKYMFNSVDVLNFSAMKGSGTLGRVEDADSSWAFIPTQITEGMLQNKDAVELNCIYNNLEGGSNTIDAQDAAGLIAYVYGENVDEFNIIDSLAQATGEDANGITLKAKIGMPYSQTNKTIEYTLGKNTRPSDTEISANVDEIYEYNKMMYISENSVNIWGKDDMHGTEEEWNNAIEFQQQYSPESPAFQQTKDFAILEIEATLPSKTKYNLVIGANGTCENDWTMVKTDYIKDVPQDPIEEKFETELTYKSLLSVEKNGVVTQKDVGGKKVNSSSTSNGMWIPGYDEENIEKDADVVVTISSTTNNDIEKVNDKTVGTDSSNPNEDGWYYVSANNRQSVAKVYKFDDYDNLVKRGIVDKETVKLTSNVIVNEEALESTEDLAIKWPYRKIEDIQEPETVDQNTTRVRKQVTTNLPIDDAYLKANYPDWAFTDDEEGETQHRIYKVVERGENYSKTIIIKAYGREDTVETTLDVKWSDFMTKLDYVAKIGDKDIGGALKDGTFYPSYDKDDIEKDADVTAIISSITDFDIAKVNDIDLNADGTPNKDGWYYVDTNNKKVIAKVYKFDTYDNLTANGKVAEKGIKLTAPNGMESTQNLSIDWVLRIIKVTYNPEKITADTKKIRVEITTNLPMDDAYRKEKWSNWEFTSDDEGKTQHRIYREFKRGDTFDGEVTVKRNGYDEYAKTSVKVDWPAPTVLPQTGGILGITAIGAATVIGVSAYTRRKYRK